MAPELSHITTQANLTRDLKTSLVKDVLEQAEVCVHRPAERTALSVAVFDAAAYDAALWKGAEALYSLLDHGRADIEPLRNRRLAERAMFLTMTMQCFASIRLALEGGVPPESMQQAWADIQSHREQLLASFTR